MATRRRTRAKPKSKASVASLLTLFPDFRPRKFCGASVARKESFIQELRDLYLHQGLVLYIGAGVSLSLGLPSWAELIRSLGVTMMGRRVESAIDTLGKLSDDEKWNVFFRLQSQVAEKTDSNRPILMMARAIKDALGENLSGAIAKSLYRPVRGWLRRRWAPFPARREAMRAHYTSKRFGNASPLPSSELLDAIVSLARAERDVRGVQAIVNYNFDDLLDEKLREQHVKCRTVLSGRDSVPQGTLPCYHVHGLISSRDLGRTGKAKTQGNFVFSEDEYHAEYSDPYRWSNMTQMSLLGRHTGLFVGLSLEDPNIRRLIDVTHRQYPENLNYAILPRKLPATGARDNSDSVMRNLFEEVESKSFEKIGVKVIWVDSFAEIPHVITNVCGTDSAS
jgi:SIR2-like domain